MRHNVQALRQRGSFAQNFAVTFSGTAAVTAIGFLLTPVMSRIHPPATYGQFAVFNSLVSNLSIVTTLVYTGAFLLPKSREKFLALVQLTVLLTFGTCTLLAGALLLGGGYVVRWSHL